jgi:hypothetical protein
MGWKGKERVRLVRRGTFMRPERGRDRSVFREEGDLSAAGIAIIKVFLEAKGSMK